LAHYRRARFEEAVIGGEERTLAFEARMMRRTNIISNSD
jgi:hypothetical protein